jgi:acyl carrier protein
MSTNELVTTDTRERVSRALYHLGIDTNAEGDLIEQLDSMLFMSAVIELEVEFEIAIPDEYLNPQFFATTDHTVSIINQLLDEQK